MRAICIISIVFGRAVKAGRKSFPMDYVNRPAHNLLGPTTCKKSHTDLSSGPPIYQAQLPVSLTFLVDHIHFLIVSLYRQCITHAYINYIL